jgi:heme-degrading monooxygenase HmoA
MLAGFARTPAPPYYAVIFTSQRADADPEYALMAQAMHALALSQAGCLGAESARDEQGLGITVSYWQSEDHIRAWKHHAEHEVARRLGRERWYAHYELRVARVERAYGMAHG